MANSASAPYEVNVTGTDDEALTFALSFENADGTAFPFDDYTIEYSIKDGPALTQGSGITVFDGVVTFDAGESPLRVGDHEHGCRIRSIASGKSHQVFTGSVRISDGGF